MGDDGLDRFKHPDIVHTEPTLMELHQYIMPRYAAKWKKLGILLGLNSGTLRAIEYDNRFKSEDCCNAMFRKWLIDYSATWKHLFTALESPAITGEDMSGQLRASTLDDGGLEQFKHPDKVNSRPLLGDLRQYFIP